MPALGPRHGSKGLQIATWILNAVALYWLLFIVPSHSNAGTSVIVDFFVYHCSSALAISWGVIGTIHMIQRWRGYPGLRARSLWVAPVLLILTLAVDSLLQEPPGNPLFRARFDLSRSALTAEALKALKTGSIANDQYIGLFHVEFASVYDGQVRFITAADCGILYSCGFVYLPSGGTLTKGVEDRLTHLEGPWWHVYEGF